MTDIFPIPILCGPTGSGKSSLAHELAKHYPIEIIVADSRQVIHHLDIGTEKPTEQEQREVRYHLIDLVEPGESYTAYRFVEDAEHAITDILSRKKIPMVVGGTGMYIRSLVRGISAVASSDEIREQIASEIVEKGEDAVYHELTVIDPTAAKQIHPKNHVRLIRALEIYRLTGQPKTVWEKTGQQIGGKFPYHAVCFLPDRAELYERIDARTRYQLAKGLLEEVRGLVKTVGEQKVRAANVICYNELLDCINGTLSLDDSVSLIQQNCRHLAKRQYTWFKKEPDFQQVTEFSILQAELTKLVSHWQSRH